ncbi:hypothetical protein H9P43_005807 [Blastocladiella emersonii ATCC 22665]|nr:hypothetical protein H9P43_005807 [Blastocladiella emersonii ATCC 22665]
MIVSYAHALPAPAPAKFGLLDPAAMVALNVPPAAGPPVLRIHMPARCSIPDLALLFESSQRQPARSQMGSTKPVVAAAESHGDNRVLLEWQPVVQNIRVLAVDAAWNLATNADYAFAMATQSTFSSSARSPYDLVFMSLDLGTRDDTAAYRDAASALDLIRWIRSHEYRRRTSTLMHTRSSVTAVGLRDRIGDDGKRAVDGMHHAPPSSRNTHYGTPVLIVGMSSTETLAETCAILALLDQSPVSPDGGGGAAASIRRSLSPSDIAECAT